MSTTRPPFICKWTSNPIFKGDVHTLALSPCGKILATGGKDGRLVFMRCNDAVFFLDVAYTSSLHSLVWNPRHNYEIIAGYADGAMKAIRLNESQCGVSTFSFEASMTSINCLSIDASGCYLAVGAGGGVKLWKYNNNSWSIVSVFHPPTLGRGDERLQAIVRSVQFLKTLEGIIVCYRDHGIICLDFAGNVKWSRTCMQPLGSMALHPVEGRIAISNLQGGIDIYDIASNNVISSFETNLGSNICFSMAYLGEKGVLLFCNDNGTAIIWDPRSGSHMQLLKHGASGLVMVAAVSVGDKIRLATATTGTGVSTRVRLWQEHTPRRLEKPKSVTHEYDFSGNSDHTRSRKDPKLVNHTAKQEQPQVTSDPHQPTRTSVFPIKRQQVKHGALSYDQLGPLSAVVLLYLLVVADYTLIGKRVFQGWSLCMTMLLYFWRSFMWVWEGTRRLKIQVDTPEA